LLISQTPHIRPKFPAERGMLGGMRWPNGFGLLFASFETFVIDVLERLEVFLGTLH
jgi:hypothetical protein